MRILLAILLLIGVSAHGAAIDDQARSFLLNAILNGADASLTNGSGGVISVTNATGTAVTAIWGVAQSTTLLRLNLSGTTTISFTNTPTAGTGPSRMMLELYTVGTAPALTIQQTDPRQIDFGPAGLFIANNATNLITVVFDGTNFLGFSSYGPLSQPASSALTNLSIRVQNTNAAYASALTVLGTGQYPTLSVTGAVTGNLTYTFSSISPGSEGTISWRSDGSARTFTFLFPGGLMKFFTNTAGLSGTNFVTVASADGALAWKAWQPGVSETNIQIAARNTP